MNVILNFFVNNYIWFLVISLILIFALIGYFTDTTPDERFVQKVELDKELEERLAAAEAANITLNQMVNYQSSKAKNTEAEAKEEELLDDNVKGIESDNEKDSSKWRIFLLHLDIIINICYNYKVK